MYNFEKAFTFLKTDPNWVKKFIIGSLILLIPTAINSLMQLVPDNNEQLLVKLLPVLIPAFILFLLFTFLVSGYYFKVINTKIEHNSDILPEWKNIGQLYLIAFKVVAASSLFLLPMFLLIILLLVVMMALKVINPLLMILPFLAIIAVFMVFIVFLSLMNMSFACDLKFSSYFNLKRAGQLLKNNTLNYVLYIIFCFALSSLLKIAAIILTLSVVGIVAVPFLSFYSYLVIAEFSAQFIKNSLYYQNLTVTVVEETTNKEEESN